MKRKVGPAQGAYAYIVALEPLAAEWVLGAQISIVEAKDAQSDLQRKGFHLLLTWWIEMAGKNMRGFEALKTDVLKVQWGVIKVIDSHGNEHFAPLKRTSTEWSWDSMSYIEKPCTKEQYSDLIETVYRMAAEDGIILPELDQKYRQGEA